MLSSKAVLIIIKISFDLNEKQYYNVLYMSITYPYAVAWIFIVKINHILCFHAIPELK